MQKDYRNFTVGELLEMGLNVEISIHNVTEQEGKHITEMFEGTKQSVHQISRNLKAVHAWKNSFKVTCYVGQ